MPQQTTQIKNRGALLNVTDIKNIESEAGIIATILAKPDFTYYSEQLKPQHFADEQNGFIYYAVSTLAKKGVEKADAYAIINILNAKESTKNWAEKLTVPGLTELIDLGHIIARDSVKAYEVLVQNVIDKAFKRDMVTKLRECQQLCYKDDAEKIQTQIYSTLDTLISKYFVGNDITPFADKVDDMWGNLESRQNNDGLAGYPSKFKEVNEYFTYKNAELILACARRKEGKSIFCLNELKHKLELKAHVLLIDSEMTDDQHYVRFLSHLSGVKVKDLKKKNYGEDGARRIKEANKWLKEHPYIHVYMTKLDKDKIFLICKKLKNTGWLDFVIVDYIKSQGSNVSSEVYNMLGEYTDFLHNRIAGELNVPVLAAAQLNRGGEIADSFKIEQFASTVTIIQRKTDEEITRDGRDCGNYKLFVKLNRLGEQMGDMDTEYIDLLFDGSRVSFEQANRQHSVEEPY